MRTGQAHLHVTPSVVCRLDAAAVPGEVVDLHVEAIMWEAEIGMDDCAGRDLQRMFRVNCGKPRLRIAAFQNELIVGSHWSLPRFA